MNYFISVLALTLNIYMEAGGEDFKGKMLVAETTINRVNSSKYPNNVIDVVLQNKQFSWTSKLSTNDEEGLIHFYRKLEVSRLKNKKENDAFDECLYIAISVLDVNYRTKSKYLHFFSGNVKPYWAKGVPLFTHGGHTFM